MHTTGTRKRRIGLLIDRIDQPGWIRDLAVRLSEDPDTESLTLILAEYQINELPKDSLSEKLSDLALGALQRAESHLLNAAEVQLFHREDMRPQVPNARVRGLVVTPSATAPREWTTDDTRQLRASGEFDLVLVLGMPIVRGDVVNMPRLGTWTIQHSDMSLSTDRHAGFWEVRGARDHSTLSIVRLGADAASDERVISRSFNTEFYWLKNKARALSLGNLALLDVLAELDAAPAAQSRVSRVPAPHALSKRNKQALKPGWQIASYVTRQSSVMAGMLMRRYQKKDVVWRVALTNGTPTGAIPATLRPPKGRFFADPFVYTHQGQPYIFFEDYAFAEGRGKISAAVCKDGQFEFLGVVLDLPYHLSFPFLFEHEGELYMLPETCGNRTIELWRCTEFPLKWELATTLMRDISAVDTILFPHDKRWWMLTNIDRTNNSSHSDELFAFYADSPTSTEWTPHALNPIVCDPDKARNGGIIITENGDIVRTAQYQGFCHYGKGLSLNRIVELTPTTYREESGAVQYPDFVKEQHPSMHHFHRHGGYAVFDFGFRE
jgi:hypothetical protein